MRNPQPVPTRHPPSNRELRARQWVPATVDGSPSSTAASGCDVRPGDVLVVEGGTFPVDPVATIRAGLQYEERPDPRTWRVMFVTDDGSISFERNAVTS